MIVPDFTSSREKIEIDFLHRKLQEINDSFDDLIYYWVSRPRQIQIRPFDSEEDMGVSYLRQLESEFGKMARENKVHGMVVFGRSAMLVNEIERHSILFVNSKDRKGLPREAISA